jgi:hypothetical protein
MAGTDDAEIRELRGQIQQLRSLVVSLGATLLRKIALESETRRPPDSGDAQRLVQEAEDCFRCARIPGLKSEIAEGLEDDKRVRPNSDSAVHCSLANGV